MTKLLAVAHLDPDRPVKVVGDLLRLDLVRNPGAAFSTGTSYTVVLSVIAVIAATVVVRFGRRLGDPTWAVALGLLLAGVCGNLTDRVFREPGVLRGHVVDFLELPHWPVFNVADMLIDAAVVLILLQTWRGIGITGRATGGRERVERRRGAGGPRPRRAGRRACRRRDGADVRGLAHPRGVPDRRRARTARRRAGRQERPRAPGVGAGGHASGGRPTRSR